MLGEFLYRLYGKSDREGPIQNLEGKIKQKTVQHVHTIALTLTNNSDVLENLNKVLSGQIEYE